MELARPRKMRLELEFNGQTADQWLEGEAVPKIGAKLKLHTGRNENGIRAIGPGWSVGRLRRRLTWTESKKWRIVTTTSLRSP
jgi:hypothetical protein